MCWKKRDHQTERWKLQVAETKLTTTTIWTVNDSDWLSVGVPSRRALAPFFDCWWWSLWVATTKPHHRYEPGVLCWTSQQTKINAHPGVEDASTIVRRHLSWSSSCWEAAAGRSTMIVAHLTICRPLNTPMHIQRTFTTTSAQKCEGKRECTELQALPRNAPAFDPILAHWILQAHGWLRRSPLSVHFMFRCWAVRIFEQLVDRCDHPGRRRHCPSLQFNHVATGQHFTCSKRIAKSRQKQWCATTRPPLSQNAVSRSGSRVRLWGRSEREQNLVSNTELAELVYSWFGNIPPECLLRLETFDCRILQKSPQAAQGDNRRTLFLHQDTLTGGGQREDPNININDVYTLAAQSTFT